MYLHAETPTFLESKESVPPHTHFSKTEKVAEQLGSPPGWPGQKQQQQKLFSTPVF
jgi:hypothetical protein